MNFGRLCTALVGIALCGFGGAFLLAPESMASQASIVLMLPGAVADIRATYGGFQVGVGLFFLLCAIRNIWIEPALTAQLFVLGGFALGRAAGVVFNGAFDVTTLSFLGLELGGFIVVSLALHMTPIGESRA